MTSALPPPGWSASKSPGLHAVASFVIPGLGTLLCGKRGRGLLILGLSAVSLFGVNLLANALIGGEPTAIGTFLAIPVWVWGMIDGYRSAQQWNVERVGGAEFPVAKAESAVSPTRRPNRPPEFQGLDLPGGDVPTRAAASTVAGLDQTLAVDICKKEGHDEEFMGYGGSGAYWVCRRCGQERDEYQGRVTD